MMSTALLERRVQPIGAGTKMVSISVSDVLIFSSDPTIVCEIPAELTDRRMRSYPSHAEAHKEAEEAYDTYFRP